MGRPVIDLTGDRYGRWTVLHRAEVDSAHVYWLCRCDCGSEVAVQASNLRHGKSRQCRACQLQAQFKPVPTYVSAHQRISAARGPAREYDCTDCGGPAAEWSYDHGDPNELVGKSSATREAAYSLDIEHYVPRCVPCHRTHDMGVSA